jgi:hypothetical protein
MKFQKNKVINYLVYFLIILIVSLILFFSPLFSNRPLGLDTLGHLSKVKYIQSSGFSSWNYVWYSGTPTFQFYSPLVFYLIALIKNIIFATNFLCFLSILLTAFGIFLVVNLFSSKLYSLFSALLFLSVLSISYYWISVGNIAYVFAWWTIPFGIFLLEKSLKNKTWILALSLVIMLGFLTHIFIGICLFFILCMRILFYFNLKLIYKNGIFYLLPGFLISCFWLIPFFAHSSSFVGEGAGYVPSIKHLFGFGDYIIWGMSPGEIGVVFFLFVFSLIFFKKWKNSNYLLFLLSTIFLLLFFLLGGLGSHYPEGVSAVRFIIPLSILICIFLGISLIKINKSKYFLMILFLILLLGLVWSFSVINKNFSEFSYSSEKFGRTAFIEEFSKDSRINLNNSFDNFRFGAYSYIFSEGFNYVFPLKSQTRGYFDQGMLDSNIMNLFFEKVWFSDDINSTLYFLNWFSIDYFEVGGNSLEFERKFENENFEKIISNELYDSAKDYPFSIYYFKDASPIIIYAKGNLVSYPNFDLSLIKNMAEQNINLKTEIPIYTKEDIFINESFEEFDFNYSRKRDFVFVNFENVGNNSFVLFKEFYHNSWKAKDLDGEKLKIYKTGPGFMLVFVPEDSKGVIFYQSNNFINYSSFFLSFIGIFLALRFSFLRIAKLK